MDEKTKAWLAQKSAESAAWRDEKIREVSLSKAAAFDWLERVGSWPSSDPDVRAVTRAAERKIGVG